MNPRELPLDRLATTDQDGKRIWLYPADVKGFFRRARTWTQIILVAVFLILPWIRIQGHPAILLDLAHRRFSILGMPFWAHDAPMLFFVFGGAAVLLAFVTAVWGRIWCGWACPQTVFVDGVFRKIESWIEGDSVQRKRLDEADWSVAKFGKKAAKWWLFSGVALVLSHSFLAYFVGTDALASMMQHSPFEHPQAFLLMTAMTSAVLFDFGWFREQFCTVVCPYGRFQAVLMDSESMNVQYQEERGEPRRGTAAYTGVPQGDCVNCYRCVQVCPTGIDIRRGLQMECIACTACIDACDDVMTRLKKPTGLIKYTQPKFGTRAWAYLGLLSVFAIGLIWAIQSKQLVEFELIRAVGAPYQEIVRSDGSRETVNHFKSDFFNQSFEAAVLSVRAVGGHRAEDVNVVLAGVERLVLEPGQSRRVDLFIRFLPSVIQQGHGKLTLELTAQSLMGIPLYVTQKEVPLVGSLK